MVNKKVLKCLPSLKPKGGKYYSENKQRLQNNVVLGLGSTTLANSARNAKNDIKNVIHIQVFFKCFVRF